MNTSMIIYFLSTTFLCLIILIVACIIFDPTKFREIDFKALSNDFCSNNHTGFDELVCKNQVKKKKFIWIMIDGLSHDQLYYLIELQQKKKISLFKMSSDLFAQTGALHEAIFTGKFSRNFIADKIEIDHFLKQAKQNGYQMSYVGCEYPVFTLDNQASSFKNIFIRNHESSPFELLCNHNTFNTFAGNYWIYENRSYDIHSRFQVIDGMKDSIKDSASIDDINKCMDEILVYKGKNSSLSLGLLYYTPYLDHLNHEYYRHHPKVIGTTLRHEKNIISLMNWIDENPDYVLIVTSDHGGQLFHGEDNFCNHGCVDRNKTNAAIMMIYYKNISVPDTLPEIISHYDVAPTIAQLIDNVNIPLEATGFPVMLHNNLLLNLVSVRSKEVQLIRLLEKYIEREGKEKQKAIELLSKLNDNIYYKTINEIYLTRKIDSLNQSLYDDYLLLVKNSQVLLLDSLFKTSSSNLILMIIMVLLIKLLFLLNLTFLKSNLRLKESMSTRWLFSLIPFYLLILNNLFIITEKNKYREVIDIISISLIVVFFFFYYFSMDFKERKSKKENNTALYSFLTISLGLIFFLIPKDSFIRLNALFISFPDNYLKNNLNFILYLTLFVYSIITIKSLKYSKYTILYKIKIRQDLIFYILQIVILFLMYNYDKIIKDKKYITSQDKETQTLAFVIYIYFLLYSIFISLNICSKDERDEIKYNSSKLIKLTIIPFIFFLCNVFERIYLIALILPSYYMISVLICKYKTNLLIKQILMICMIRYTDLFFNIMNGTFTFEVSLDSGNKTISRYKEDNPGLTGFFFGIHKFKVYLMLGSFILGLSKFRRFELNEIGILFNNLIYIKSIISMIFFMYFLNYDIQELFFDTFMMFLCQTITILVIFIYLLIGTTSYYIRESIIKISIHLLKRKNNYYLVNIEDKDIREEIV